jgi:hypothetical protein
MITVCVGCQLQETRRVFSTRFMIQLNGGISQQTFLKAMIFFYIITLPCSLRIFKMHLYIHYRTLKLLRMNRAVI